MNHSRPLSFNGTSGTVCAYCDVKKCYRSIAISSIHAIGKKNEFNFPININEWIAYVRDKKFCPNPANPWIAQDQVWYLWKDERELRQRQHPNTSYSTNNPCFLCQSSTVIFLADNYEWYKTCQYVNLRHEVVVLLLWSILRIYTCMPQRIYTRRLYCFQQSPSL